MTLFLAVPEGITPLGQNDPQTPSVGVIPGDDVALHRVMLAETRPGRRLAEARMRATDLAAQPIEDLHVAIGAAEADGGCWLAIVDRERMAAHLAHFRAAGTEPANLTPAAMLLPPPDETMVDGVATARLGPLTLLRGMDFAAAVEEPLAATLAPDATNPPPLRPNPLTPLTLDLRQGEFAPRVDWWKQPGIRWAIGLLLLAAILLALTPLLVERSRAADTIASHEETILGLAERLLGERPADADAAASALQTARLAAETSVVAPRLAFLTRKLASDARLDQVGLEADGTLALTLTGPAEAIEATTAALRADPAFAVESDGLHVRIGQRPLLAIPPDASAADAATARLVAARGDAAILMAHRRAAPDASATETDAIARQALDRAGLADTEVTAEAANITITLPRVRPPALLSLLADIEAQGGHIGELAIQPNLDSTAGDSTVAADIGITR